MVMFVCQPTFSTLDLKDDKGTDYIIAWKSKELFKFRLRLLYNAFLPNIKPFGWKIRMQFNNTVLVIEQDAYIIYNLFYWPRNPLNNFVLKLLVSCN